MAPSSPTSPNIAPKGLPNEWTIEEVIQYITSTDPGLAVHADLFRTHVSLFVSVVVWMSTLKYSLSTTFVQYRQQLSYELCHFVWCVSVGKPFYSIVFKNGRIVVATFLAENVHCQVNQVKRLSLLTISRQKPGSSIRFHSTLFSIKLWTIQLSVPNICVWFRFGPLF